MLDLGNMGKVRNFRPIQNDTNAEKYSDRDQQSETGRPAVMLVFIDVGHDYLPMSELRAPRGGRKAAATANEVAN